MTTPGWKSWTRATEPTPSLESLGVFLETQPHDTDPTGSHNVRSRVIADWLWTGGDESSARFSAMDKRGTKVADATAAGTGTSLTLGGTPTEGDTLMVVTDFDAAGGSGKILQQQWHMMVWDDPTIYTLTTDTVQSFMQIVSAAASPRGIALDLVNRLIYWVSSGDSAIYSATLEGNNKTEIIASLSNPWDVTVDLDNDKIYWSEITSNKIRSADLDGSNPADVITGLNDPRGIVYYNGFVYWCSWGDNKIKKADIATWTAADVTAGVSGPRYIDVDTVNDLLFWTEYTGDKIQRCEFDGANVTEIIGSINEPRGIAVDPVNERMYYARDNDKIYSLAIDGSDSPTEIFNSGEADDPRGVAFDATTQILYWGNDDDNDIYRGSSSGQQAATITVSPAITAATELLGAGAPVHFFIPQEVGAPKSTAAESYSVAVSEQFNTAYVRVFQPES